MAYTKARASRAVDLLRADYEEVRQLFRDYEALADAASKKSLFARISEVLIAHAELEEEGFYPAIAELGTEGQEHVRQGILAREAISELLLELAGMDARDKLFDVRMKAVSLKVEQHASREEKVGFPLFGRLDQETRDQVSLALWSLKLGSSCDEEELRGEPPASTPPDPGL
jgi:hemerythrin superfamily protein